MLPALALTLLAQSPCDLFLVDSGGDQIARFAELDGVAGVGAVHEASSLWRGAASLTPRAAAFRLGPGGAEGFWVESAKDRLFRGVDVNGNGVLEAFETQTWRDSGKLDGPSLALDLVATADGALWWCSESGLAGLFRCADGDGDGLAQSPGELVAMVGGSATTHAVETGAGSAVVDAGHLVGLAADGNGVAAYGTGADEALFRFEDLDGDGDVLDPGESRLVLNASGKNPALPQNEDWAAGRLRSLVVPSDTGATFYGRLSHVARAVEGGETVWYLGCDSHAAAIFGTNQFHHGLNGLVFRGVDRNGDGDLQDAGEVRLFHDGSHTNPFAPGFEQILGLAACGGEVYVAYSVGAGRRVARLHDRDGDGDASDPLEVEPLWFDSDAWGAATPFAAGPPIVRDLSAFDAGAFAEPNALFETSGTPCALTATPSPPTLHGVGRARLGARFTCELRGAQGGAPALLLVGDDAPGWFEHPLPADLGIVGYAGCLLYLHPVAGRVALTSGPAGHPSAGYAAVTFDVPDDPWLVDRVFRFQWVVPDLYHWPYLGGTGISMTGRGQVVIER